MENVNAASLSVSVSLPQGALTQAIRNFAKSLEGWLNNAMSAVPQKMVQTKVSLRGGGCRVLLPGGVPGQTESC